MGCDSEGHRRSAPRLLRTGKAGENRYNLVYSIDQLTRDIVLHLLKSSTIDERG